MSSMDRKKFRPVEATYQCTLDSGVFLSAFYWTAEDNEQTHG